MADVTLTRQQVDRDGLAPSYTALDNVDTYFVDNASGDVFVHFKNTGGSASTVTFDITKTVAGLSVTDPTVTVPATTGDLMVGPFPVEWETTGGDIKFTQDQASGVTAANIRL